MPTLDETLARFGARPGVEQLLLLGRDGLLVHRSAGSAHQGEIVAAALPQLIAACEQLGEMTGRGTLKTAVLELGHAVLIAQPLSPDLVLAVMLAPSAPFGPLLAELRTRRREILELI